MALSIGEIEATLRLKNEMTAPLEEAKAKMREAIAKVDELAEHLGLAGEGSGMFAKAFVTAAEVTAAAAAAAAVAIGTITYAVYELGGRGSQVNDVSAAFELLTSRIGIDAPAALEEMRKGVVGTISDFDLMKDANRAMGAGLRPTEEQFLLIAEAARSLAKSTGKEIPAVFDLIISALTSGRAKSLQQAGAFVELKGASAELKAQLSATGEEMSTGADLATKRGAVFEALGIITKRLGVHEADFKEKLEAGAVAFRNWYDNLAVAVAESPVLAALLDNVGKELVAAFGPDKEAAIKNIVKWVEQSAISLIEMAKYGVDAASYIGVGFHALMTVLGDTAQIIDGVALATLYLGKASMLLPNSVGVGTAAFKANDEAIGSLLLRMSDRGKALQDGKKAEEDWAGASGKANEALDRIKAAMVEASKHTDQLAESHKKAGAATDDHAAAVVGLSKVEQEIAKAAQEEFKKNMEMAEKLSHDIERGVMEHEVQKSEAIGKRQLDLMVQAGKAHEEMTKQRGANEEAAMQAAIDAATASGAKWQQVYSMEAALSKKKLDDNIAEENRRYALEVAGNQRSSYAEIQAYEAASDKHTAIVNGMTEEWVNAENTKRIELERTHSKWLQTLHGMKDSAMQLESDVVGHLGRTLFGLGFDPTGELKVAAETAKKEYEKIAHNGKASAQEVMAAFKKWHEAEDAANFTTAERFKEVWLRVKSTLQEIFDQILKYFLEKFIVGLINGMGGARLGDRLGALLTGGIGKGGGGLMGEAASAGAGLLGLGAGGTGAAAGVAGVEGSIFAGGGAAAGGGAGAAGTAGGIGLSASTVGITAGIGAGALLAYGIWKKGLFRGGEEALKVNPARDAFLSQFGGPGTGQDSGFRHLADVLFGLTHNESQFHALTSAQHMKEYNAAVTGITNTLHKGHIPGFKFGSDGLQDFGDGTMVELHGREAVLTEGQLGGGGMGSVHNTFNIHVSTLDAEGMDRLFDSKIIPRINMELLTNRSGLVTRINKAVTGKTRGF